MAGEGLNKNISESVCVCIGEPSIQHVESSPLSQGVADMSQSLPPSIQYRPGLPTSYLPPPPPGTMFTPTLFRWNPSSLLTLSLLNPCQVPWL